MENKIREYRKKYGVSQQLLGDAVGLAQNSISALENGTYNPTLEHAMMIAGVFGCTVYDIWKMDPWMEGHCRNWFRSFELTK